MRNYISMRKYLCLFPVFMLSIFPRELSNASVAKPDNQAIIYGYIKTLSPAMSSERAKDLAWEYDYVCHKYGISPRLFVSIAYQENRFRLSGISSHGDVGHMQVNYRTWRGLGYSKHVLNTNWRLNSNVGAKILSGCMSKYHGKAAPWTCYNARSHKKQLRYQRAVEKHLTKL